ncbi:hypothetical protein DP939_11405 [Spongiactinospora rosea]|uniref:Uncharacterized protein n=1 Tax=Spongiactinospora rosea TaxID=2248750 RepID=A0A366M2X9_9ACTN|nr:hypothetical protein [Spongiactinospora rosea]RBQ20387.1 hypothetical protein DP939_11405 [Spongiactinospora rosea]
MSRAPARRRRRTAPPRRTPPPAPRRTPPPPPLEENALARWGLDHRQQRILTIIAVTAGVIIAAVALTYAITGLGGGVSAGETESATSPVQARPDAYHGWASTPVFAPIAARTADARALTVKEVFGQKTLKAGKISLKLVATKLDGDCAAAAWGAPLTERLAAGECNQALRGLYASADNRYVAQYTLFNLRDTEAANTLVNDLETLHRGGWAAALPAERAAMPRDGHTEASGHAMGHYAGLVWIGRGDGAEPAASDDFVTLSLAVRGVEKSVYRRIVAASGTPTQ